MAPSVLLRETSVYSALCGAKSVPRATSIDAAWRIFLRLAFEGRGLFKFFYFNLMDSAGCMRFLLIEFKSLGNYNCALEDMVNVATLL